MESRLTIITLGVADLTASEHFYNQVFGWPKAESSNENIIFFTLNGLQLALYPRQKLAEDAGLSEGGQGFAGFSLAHNLRSTDDVDLLFEHFKNLNVPIIKPPQKVFWGGYSGYLSDPDGYLWEIAYNPYLSLDEAGNISGG